MSYETRARVEEIIGILVKVRYLSFGQIQKFLIRKDPNKLSVILVRLAVRDIVKKTRFTIPSLMKTVNVYCLGRGGKVHAGRILDVDPEMIRTDLSIHNIPHQLDVAEVFLGAFDAETIKERVALRSRVDWRDSAYVWLDLPMGGSKSRLSPDARIVCPETGRVIFLEVDRATKSLKVLRGDLEKYNYYLTGRFESEHPGMTPDLLYSVTNEARKRSLMKIWKKAGGKKYLPLNVFVGLEPVAAAVRGWGLSDAPVAARVSEKSEKSEKVIQALKTISDWTDRAVELLQAEGIALEDLGDPGEVSRAWERLGELADEIREES